MRLDGSTSEDDLTAVFSMPFRLDKGCLIDFETTGLPQVGDSHEVVTLGYLRRDQIVIMQRKTSEKVAFYDKVRGILRDLPRPFFSYNTRFERDIIKVELGIDAPERDFEDLMLPWRRKASQYSLKWPSLDDLISEPEDYFEEGKITGAKIPQMWAEYLGDASKRWVLKMIMEHCFSDILREATLLLRFPQLGAMAHLDGVVGRDVTRFAYRD